MGRAAVRGRAQRHPRRQAQGRAAEGTERPGRVRTTGAAGREGVQSEEDRRLLQGLQAGDFLAAEHSRTGKKLSKKVIDEFEAQEALRDQELEKVRLKNINLRNALKKCEAKLRAKEQLAE